MKTVIFNLTALLICLCLVKYYREEAKAFQEKALAYNRQNEILRSTIKDLYHEKIKLEQTNQALEAAAASEKAYFNWYQDISNSAVIKRLRQN